MAKTVNFRVAAIPTIALGMVMSGWGAEGPTPPHTPQQALGLLRAGNDRYVRNTSTPVSLSVNRRQELANGQHLTAMVLSCADSRVPPEHVRTATRPAPT